MPTHIKPPLERIEKGQIGPGTILSHRISLDQAPECKRSAAMEKEDVTKNMIDPGPEMQLALLLFFDKET